MNDTEGQKVLKLSDGIAEVDILPRHGAAISRYEVLQGGNRRKVFEPTPFGEAGEAPKVAAILLAPWSNRISGGGFEYDGRFVALAPNMAGEPLPIHGNAFQLPWTVVEQKDAAARLELRSAGPGEFRYLAEVGYTLAGGELCVDLAITNTGESALPFGLGIHPWLPRTRKTRLMFDASEVWLEDAQFLPAGRIALGESEKWRFSEARALPDDWINNAFSGWDGKAEVIWPESKLRLRIEASRNLGHCIVFSPDASAPFFCFEPVSHPVDAHHQGAGGLSSLRRLAPGEAMRVWCRFAPSAND